VLRRVSRDAMWSAFLRHVTGRICDKWQTAGVSRSLSPHVSVVERVIEVCVLRNTQCIFSLVLRPLGPSRTRWNVRILSP